MDDQWRRHQLPRPGELMQRGGGARGRDRGRRSRLRVGCSLGDALHHVDTLLPSWRSRRTTRSAAARPRSFTCEPSSPCTDGPWMGQKPRPIGIQHLVRTATRRFDRSCRPSFLRRANYRSTGGSEPVVLCRSETMVMLAAPEVIPTITVHLHQPCDGTFGFDAFQGFVPVRTRCRQPSRSSGGSAFRKAFLERQPWTPASAAMTAGCVHARRCTSRKLTHQAADGSFTPVTPRSPRDRVSGASRRITVTARTISHAK
jgi:hypothetical protein